MSLFGSLFTGVSGLDAQSQSTAMIANNIANISTTGFKRSEAAFSSLVTSEGRSTRYSPGTVATNRLQRVDHQGPIQQTTSSTDAAISGNGFFPVKRDTIFTQEFLYTRSGSFSEDSNGLLRNTSGFALYAWPIDTNGDIPPNNGDLISLVPANVAFLGGLTRPTTDAEFAINLDADEVDTTISNALVVAPDFSRGLTVFDTLGAGQTLTFEYTKVFGPAATVSGATSNLITTDQLVTDLGLTPGDTFTYESELGGPFTLTVVPGAPALPGEVETIKDILDEINGSGIGVSAFLGNDSELVIQRDDFLAGAVNTLTLENTLGSPLTALGITLPPGPQTFFGDDLGAPGVYDNGLFTDIPPYSNSSGLDFNDFPAFQSLPGDAAYNERGWWQLRIVHPDGSELSKGLINFNGDGTLNALADNTGAINIELNQIDWNNGSEPQNIDIDIERLSQFAGNYDVIFADQNGAELGLRTGVELTRDGRIVARFSNGATSDLYQIPVVTFSNPNGLTEVSGTAYAENDKSGEENLRIAGTGKAGFLEPSTIEASNVDLADEFSKLIVAQRAFSSNTRLINTVDQMTEDLLRII